MIGKSLGHHEILDTVGSGGMGQVYRARDKKLGRDVAVKLLPVELRTDKEALARFEREAKALATLNHPNIVTIYSIEKYKGSLFLTMELVEGKPLDSFISDGGMMIDEFEKIAIPLTEAVAAAHAKGVIHRDLKPSNIMLDADGRVKVLDFGLAKLAETTTDTDETLASDGETQAGQLLGTVAYMSPEQAEGQHIDLRSDIFSLGIVFYQMATGQNPFQRKATVSTLAAILKDTPAPIRELNNALPPALGEIIDRCLRKIPAERYADGDELRQALRALTATLATTAETSSEIQSAFDVGHWEEAHRLLEETSEQRELTPTEMEMLATCATWLSEIDEAIEIREKVHAIYAKSGQQVAAGRVALDLAVDYLHKRNAGAVARGWQKRAERFLESEPECIELGYLRRRQTMVALSGGDFERAVELNAECADIAKRFNDVDLQTVALHDHGQILVARGDVEDGTALVDEAMTSAVSGDVGPMTVGALYCRTMSVCESLADFNRAREWSEVAWRWCESYQSSPFPGVCRVHSAETMRHLGLWEEAEEAVRNACDDFTRHRQDSHAGEAYNELGELALRKGDYQEADEAFRRAHEFGYDPVPGLPLLRIAQGKGDAAWQTIERALSESPTNRLQRAKLLAASITIALATDQLSSAETAIDELTDISRDFDCPMFKAHALMGRGALELERGTDKAATPILREAWSILNEMGLAYDAARARSLLALAYLRAANKDDAKLQLEAARKTFGELGAKPDLERVSELIKQTV